MKIEATAKQIRALLEYAAANPSQGDLGVETRRPAAAAAPRTVPRPILDRYHSLVDAGRGPAVVPIERGTCCGCHVRLPTMLEHLSHGAPALHTCPHCRRMMYSPELLGDVPVAAVPVVVATKPRRPSRATSARRS